jgi:hypothetical protein
MTGVQKTSATVLQVLQWYDYPELVLLRISTAEYVLAVRSGDMASSATTYLGGSMNIKHLREYAQGKCDLRYAIAHANLRRFWKFTFDGSERSVDLTKVVKSNQELLKSIPDAGMFSRDHVAIDVVKKTTPNTVEKFDIDGGWELGELSQLYGQVEDIYYIASDIDRYESDQTTAKERLVISSAFDRNWNGGGSYVSFYKDVANDNDFHAPLMVSGITYNSPGHVKIYANKEPFDHMLSLLIAYQENTSDIKKAHNKLGQYMAINKLNGKGAALLPVSDEVKAAIAKLAVNLEKFMPGIKFSTLRDMTSGNSVIAAKVLLSIYRRIERLYKFFEQGRVAHPALNT